MNWKNLTLTALFALVITTAIPLVSALDLNQCGNICTIRNGQTYTAASGNTYNFDTLTIERGAAVVTDFENVPRDVANGGTVSINANNLFVSGTMSAIGLSRNAPLNGGNGGTINLYIKDRFELSPTGAVLAFGGNSRYSINPAGACPQVNPGNGGNGGQVNLHVTPNTIVNALGEVNVSAGTGATPNEQCPDLTAGLNGQDGIATLTEDFEVEIRNTVISFDFPRGNIPLGFPNNAKSGQSINAKVNAIDQFGRPFNPEITWTSSNSQVVRATSINSTHANLTAIKVGTSTITATSLDGNWRALMVITVKPGDVAMIAPEVDTLDLLSNRQTVIKLNPTDANGNEIENPMQDATYDDRLTYRVEAQSTTTARLELSRNGKNLFVTPGAPGVLFITIGFAGQEATQQFTVDIAGGETITAELTPKESELQIGNQIQYTLTALNEHDQRINLTSDSQINVTYSVSNSNIAEITRTGRLTAKRLGVVTVTAKVMLTETLFPPVPAREIARATAKVTIVNGPASQIEIKGPLVLTAGQSVQYKAKVTDAAEAQLGRDENNDAFEYIWIADKGTIYANGTYVAKQAGDVTITVALANNRNVVGYKTIAVYPKEQVNDILVKTTTITAGTPTQLQAIGVDEYGNELETVDATWTIVPGTGTAALSGSTITGQKQGEVDVIAHFTINGEEVTQIGTIQVNHGTATSIEVTPSSKRVKQGTDVTLSIKAVDKYGNEFTPSVTWTTSNSNIATVNNDGVVETENEGTVTITAKLSGDSNVKDTATITVDDIQTGTFQVRTVSGQVQTAAPVETKFTKVKITPDETTTSNSAGSSTGLFTATNSSDLTISALILVALLVAAGLYYYTTKPVNV